MPPRVIIVDCDFGAEWPTWAPAAHEPPETGRTDYLPFDDVALPGALRERLRAWQRWWEVLTWPPDDEDHVIDQPEWRHFLAEGRSLVDALQRELGEAVEVRFGFENQ